MPRGGSGYMNVPKERKLVKALYSYSARSKDEISFNKGDQMHAVVEDSEDWWHAKHSRNKSEGYIPRNYVALDNSLEASDWFLRNVSRSEAEKLLLVRTNPPGTFLIRDSETQPGSFTLSVKDTDVNSLDTVKHYRIGKLDDDRGYFLNASMTFPTLTDLVEYGREQLQGPLHCRLTGACPVTAPALHDLSHSTKDKWEITPSSIKLGDQLGAGNFGVVRKGMWKKTIPVAVKTLKDQNMDQDKFVAEAQIMKRLKHKHLVSLLAICTQSQPFLIVTELMCNGSLREYLTVGLGQNLPFHGLLDIASQVADGMTYMEANQYIHRDLAARNVLVGENNYVKICDFGLARLLKENDEIYTAQTDVNFPVKWTAPEANSFRREFSTKSDVWSYGILLYEIVTHGKKPYEGMTNIEVIAQVERGHRLTKPLDCPDALYDIMSDCWKYQPEERPTFHHLFSTIDDYQIATESQYGTYDGIVNAPAKLKKRRSLCTLM